MSNSVHGWFKCFIMSTIINSTLTVSVFVDWCIFILPKANDMVFWFNMQKTILGKLKVFCIDYRVYFSVSFYVLSFVVLFGLISLDVMHGKHNRIKLMEFVQWIEKCLVAYVDCERIKTSTDCRIKLIGIFWNGSLFKNFNIDVLMMNIFVVIFGFRKKNQIVLVQAHFFRYTAQPTFIAPTCHT